MQKLDKIALSVVLLSMLMIRRGIALKCYECDSEDNPECKDITKSSSIKMVDCRPPVSNNGHDRDSNNWLKKITRIDYYGDSNDMNVPMVCQTFQAKKGDETIIYRGCQLSGGKTDICETVKAKASREDADVVVENCSTCEEDGCNKSSLVQLTSLWMLMVPLILKKLV